VANRKEPQRRVAKKRKKEDNPFQKSKPNKKGSPPDGKWYTAGAQELPQVEGSMALMETMIQEIVKSEASSSEVTKKPGRPAQLSWQFLTIGIVFCLLALMEIAVAVMATG
jgi:hypothetical protein